MARRERGRESKREGRKFCQLQYYGSCSGALANRKPAAAGAGSSSEFMASEMARKCCHCLSSGRENKREQRGERVRGGKGSKVAMT